MSQTIESRNKALVLEAFDTREWDECPIFGVLCSVHELRSRSFKSVSAERGSAKNAL